MTLLREPLLHFILAGTLLFGGYRALNHDESGAANLDPVRIGTGEIRWLQETFANQWRREPSAEELNGLVTNLLEEELLAREARVLGLDQSDTIVRRRLAQKLTFLVEDTTSIAEPTDEELRRFFSANAELFRTEPRLSFEQIFFDTVRRQSAESDAEAARKSLSVTANEIDPASLGDLLLLEASFDAVDRQTLSNLFGADFAQAVFALAPGPWSGPIESGYGIHLVRVTRLDPAEPRSFDDVHDKVREEWRRQRAEETRASYLAKLREKYGVAIDDDIRPLLPPEIEKASVR